MPDKKHKILFILHYPPPIHGSSVVGLQIKESEVINETFECRYLNLGTSKTIDEIGKNAFAKIKRYISILLQVIRNLIVRRPDLCYLAITAQGLGFYKDAVVVLLVKLFRVKPVYHFHNKGVIKRQDKFIDNLLYRFVFKNADVILLSPHLYPDIQKYIPANVVHYCPNGMQDQVKSQKSKRSEYPASEGVEVKRKNLIVEILFLSNMFETKGVFVLLDACKILKQKNLHFHCTFVGGRGDITEKRFQDKVITNDLINYVNYMGKKYGSDKESFFSNADIFSFPSYYETFGLVNLEAMQYELPVVSTFEGGIPDVVKDGVTGFLVPQKDSNALAEKLELLILNKELREEMGRKGRMRYEQNFTLQNFEDRLNTILTECLLKTY